MYCWIMSSVMFITCCEIAGCLSQRPSGVLLNNLAIMLCSAYSSLTCETLWVHRLCLFFKQPLKMGTEETFYFCVCVCVFFFFFNKNFIDIQHVPLQVILHAPVLLLIRWLHYINLN